MTCGQDNTVRLWNPHRQGVRGGTALLIKTYGTLHGKGILDIDISFDNKIFASCGNDLSAFTWDVSTGKMSRKFWDHDKRINCVRFSKDASLLLTASYDTKIRAFDLRSRNSSPIQTLKEFQDSVSSMVVTDHEIIGGSMHTHPGKPNTGNRPYR